MFNEIEKYRIRNKLTWGQLADQINDLTQGEFDGPGLRDIVMNGRRCKLWKREALIQFLATVTTRGIDAH